MIYIGNNIISCQGLGVHVWSKDQGVFTDWVSPWQSLPRRTATQPLASHSSSALPRTIPSGNLVSKSNKRQDEFNQIFELKNEELIEGSLPSWVHARTHTIHCLGLNELHLGRACPSDDRSDYSCAYQSDKLLYHGRMYVSHNYVCFHSQIFKKTIVHSFLWSVH